MLSRRAWLVRLSTMAGLTRGGRAAESPKKITQAAANYRDSPNIMQMCGMCRFYIHAGGRAGSGMMGGQMGPA